MDRTSTERPRIAPRVSDERHRYYGYSRKHAQVLEHRTIERSTFYQPPAVSHSKRGSLRPPKRPTRGSRATATPPPPRRDKPKQQAQAALKSLHPSPAPNANSSPSTSAAISQITPLRRNSARTLYCTVPYLVAVTTVDGCALDGKRHPVGDLNRTS